MAVIRLQLVVDPMLHPELHRLLHAIQDEDARAERVRQLAGTGLLWESLRLQAADAGSASLLVPSLGEEPSGRPLEPLEPRPRTAVGPAADETDAALEPALASPARRDRDPWPPGQEEGAPDNVFLLELASAMEQLPVLTETIDPAQLHAEPPTPPAAHLRLTGTRSRLQRMKDKGLFRNE